MQFIVSLKDDPRLHSASISMAARIQSKIPEPLVISEVLLMPGDPPPLRDSSPVSISTCQQALAFSDDALGLPDVYGAGGPRCPVMQFSQRGPLLELSPSRPALAGPHAC